MYRCDTETEANALVKEAKDNNLGRMEWTCLNWNEPSIKFYKSLGAVSLDEWKTYRLDESKFDYLVKVKATN